MILGTGDAFTRRSTSARSGQKVIALGPRSEHGILAVLQNRQNSTEDEYLLEHAIGALPLSKASAVTAELCSWRELLEWMFLGRLDRLRDCAEEVSVS